MQKNGVPCKIISDNGCEFINNLMIQLAKYNNITWVTNSPGHHQTVGCIERANQTFLRKLKKINNFEEIGWKRHIQDANDAYNYSFHSSLGTSPYMLKFGKLPMLAIDVKNNAKDKDVSLQSLYEKREEKIDRYRKNIIKGKREDKRKFVEGDKVMIFKERLGNKMGLNWTKGYEICKILSDDAYVVRNNDSEIRLNKSHIKKEF